MAAQEQVADSEELSSECRAAKGQLVDVAALSDDERKRVLVALTTRFSGAFLRWTDTQAAEGFTYSRLRLLEMLDHDGPAIMRELGDELGLSPRNMTALIDNLEDARLVVRRPYPNDRRATLVELAPGGLEAARQVLKPGLDGMAKLFEELSEGEQIEYAEVLRRLMEAMALPPGPC
jgi:DNA-binding MarR family transcriptional regulator